MAQQTEKSAKPSQYVTSLAKEIYVARAAQLSFMTVPDNRSETTETRRQQFDRLALTSIEAATAFLEHISGE